MRPVSTGWRRWNSQREKLAAEAKRFAQLVRTIDRTIDKLKGDRAMKDADLYKGISPEKQAEYETWLIDRYGGDMRRADRRQQEVVRGDDRGREAGGERRTQGGGAGAR